MKTTLEDRTIRSNLEAKRKEITDRLQVNRAEPDEPLNPDRADLAQEYANRERRLALVERLEKVLGDVESALQRLDEGTYRQCARCGEDIASDRLAALPYAILCVDCQEQVQAPSRFR